MPCKAFSVLLESPSFFFVYATCLAKPSQFSSNLHPFFFVYGTCLAKPSQFSSNLHPFFCIWYMPCKTFSVLLESPSFFLYMVHALQNLLSSPRIWILFSVNNTVSCHCLCNIIKKLYIYK